MFSNEGLIILLLCNGNWSTEYIDNLSSSRLNGHCIVECMGG